MVLTRTQYFDSVYSPHNILYKSESGYIVYERLFGEWLKRYTADSAYSTLRYSNLNRFLLRATRASTDWPIRFCPITSPDRPDIALTYPLFAHYIRGKVTTVFA